MFASRTAKTLVALSISMTVAAAVLLLLETAPVQVSAQNLAAVSEDGSPGGAVIRDTAVPIQAIKWRNIVLRSSAGGRQGADHFRVGEDGRLVATSLWRRQQSGNVVYVPGRDFNADSIGICLVGDFSAEPPSGAQWEAVIDLVGSLQKTFRIPADRVYLQRELDRASDSPGDAFPAGRFNRSLSRK
jgi:hypothetical protein